MTSSEKDIAEVLGVLLCAVRALQSDCAYLQEMLTDHLPGLAEEQCAELASRAERCRAAAASAEQSCRMFAAPAQNASAQAGQVS